jgi:hypothetical protein
VTSSVVSLRRKNKVSDDKKSSSSSRRVRTEVSVRVIFYARNNRHRMVRVPSAMMEMRRQSRLRDRASKRTSMLMIVTPLARLTTVRRKRPQRLTVIVRRKVIRAAASEKKQNSPGARKNFHIHNEF